SPLHRATCRAIRQSNRVIPMPRLSRISLTFALSSLLAACSVTTEVGGPCQGFQLNGMARDTTHSGEPCGDTQTGHGQFYYPSGVTVDPLVPTIVYVTNANADLRYSGGTVAAVDTAKFECARAYALAK